jgi:2-polyprenyl-6-methoxyphenol hydroxylase-like FAD-dependent oxidoreductase
MFHSARLCNADEPPRNFERVDQDDGGVRVQFAGGRVERADILIGGECIRSSVSCALAHRLDKLTHELRSVAFGKNNCSPLIL